MIITKYYLGDQIKKNEMGRARSAYGGEERCIEGFGREPEGEIRPGRPRRRSKDNIGMYLQKNLRGGMYWIDLALNMGRWRAVVNAALNLQVP